MLNIKHGLGVCKANIVHPVLFLAFNVNIFICFEVIPESAQGLLLSMCSGVSSGGIRRLYSLLGIKPQEATFKAITLTNPYDILPSSWTFKIR